MSKTDKKYNKDKTEYTDEFIISRKRWSCGNNLPDSVAENKLYLRSNRKMCCLGFYARHLGNKVCDIQGIPTPAQTGKNVNWPEWMLAPFHNVSWDTNLLMQINDNSNLSGPAREKKIKSIFAKHGVKVKFVP